jgi:hypothetical protein
MTLTHEEIRAVFSALCALGHETDLNEVEQALYERILAVLKSETN